MRTLLFFLLFMLVSTVATAGQPLQFAMPDDENDYVSLSILKAAYGKLGMDVEGVVLPPRRALADSDAGKTDGEVNRIKAIEHQHHNLIRVPEPINAIDGMAFTCGGPIPIDGWDSLRGLRIGVRHGIRFAEMATRGWSDIYTANEYDHLFDLLFRGRLDVVVASRKVGQAQSRRDLTGCLRANEPPLQSIPLYHYLHKRHEDLVPAITRTLKQMRASGEYDAVAAKAAQLFRDRQSQTQWPAP